MSVNTSTFVCTSRSVCQHFNVRLYLKIRLSTLQLPSVPQDLSVNASTSVWNSGPLSLFVVPQNSSVNIWMSICTSRLLCQHLNIYLSPETILSSPRRSSALQDHSVHVWTSVWTSTPRSLSVCALGLLCQHFNVSPYLSTLLSTSQRPSVPQNHYVNTGTSVWTSTPLSVLQHFSVNTSTSVCTSTPFCQHLIRPSVPRTSSVNTSTSVCKPRPLTSL